MSREEMDYALDQAFKAVFGEIATKRNRTAPSENRRTNSGRKRSILRRHEINI